jgi:hypothetical protein
MLPICPCRDTQCRQLLQILALTVCGLYIQEMLLTALSIDSSENNWILADRFKSTFLVARYKERMIRDYGKHGSWHSSPGWSGAARVQFQVSSCGICDGQSSIVIFFLRLLRISLPIFILVKHISPIFHEGLVQWTINSLIQSHPALNTWKSETLVERCIWERL